MRNQETKLTTILAIVVTVGLVFASGCNYEFELISPNGNASGIVTATPIPIDDHDNGQGGFGIQVTEPDPNITIIPDDSDHPDEPTPPSQATNPSPENGAVGILLDADLSWESDGTVESYLIYMGLQDNLSLVGNQSDLSFDPGELEPGQEYYWRVDSVAGQEVTTGETWSFTTGFLPAQVTSYFPEDGATLLDLNSTFTWEAANNADSYIVKIGTSIDSMIANETDNTTFTPVSLEPASTYYWSVSSVNQFGSTDGVIQSFSTVGPPEQVVVTNPEDGAIGVSTSVSLTWEASDGADGYRVFFGIVSPANDLGCTDSLGITPGNLEVMTTYYWRVDAYNSVGTTEGEVITFVTGQGPLSVEWVKSAGGPSFDFVDAMTTTPDGGTLVAGYFYDYSVFAHGEAEEQTINALTSSTTDRDIFIAKYSSNGTLLWVKTIGGSGVDRAHGIASSPDGSFFLTGYFSDEIIFGKNEAYETSFQTTSSYHSDIFVARFSVDGNLIWARQALGEGEGVNGYDVASLPDGSCLVTGYYAEVTVFSHGQEDAITKEPINPDGCHAAFVAKYTSEGALLFVVDACTSDMSECWYTEAYSIAANPDGSFYISGMFESSAVFGYGEANETVLTEKYVGDGDDDNFLAKYNADGSLAWARSLQEPDEYSSGALALAVTPDGNVVIAGNFLTTITLDVENPEATSFESGGNKSEILMASYNQDGSLDWAKKIGSSGVDMGTCLKVSAEGNVYLAGSVYDPGTGVVFGSDSATPKILTSPLSKIPFIAVYEQDGQFVTVKSIESNSSVKPYRNNLAVSNEGVFVASSFKLPALFGKDEPNETELVSTANTDIFVLKLSK